MANTKQARKRVKQAEKHRKHNASLRSRLRTAIKKVVAAISTGDQTQADTAFQSAVPVIDSMVNKGILHKNKAARHKSRLFARAKKLSATA